MQLVDATGIPVVRTLMAKSAMPDKHPLALGMMGLPVGPPRPPRLPARDGLLAWVRRVVDDMDLGFDGPAASG